MTAPALAYAHANPVAESLTGPDAQAVLATAVGSIGAQLDSWKATSVHTRPGAETSVVYDVVANGQPMHLVASSVDLDEEQRARVGAVRLDSTIGSVHVWRHPADPHLSGLPAVCDKEILRHMLAKQLGQPTTVSKVEMLVYRPLRRAVFKVDARVGDESQVWFVKVVRPHRGSDVMQRHLLFDGVGAPQCYDLGSGIILLANARGRSLARHLVGQDPGAVLRRAVDPQELIGLLNRIPQQAKGFTPRATPTERLERYADGAISAKLDPALVNQVVDLVRTVVHGTDTGPVVPTHGDFNVANIFVADHDGVERVDSFIDLDTLGPGHRIDDLACLIAHLAVLPSLAPDKYTAVPDFLTHTLEVFDHHVDPAALRARAAAVVLSLAGGCPIVERANTWLAIARDLALAGQVLMRDVS